MTDARTPRMIPACDAGPTHSFLAKHFPDLRCDREQEHAPPHRMRRGPADVDWWWDGCIGKEEQLVMGMIRDSERERVRREKAEAREAKRRDTKTEGMFKERKP